MPRGVNLVRDISEMGTGLSTPRRICKKCKKPFYEFRTDCQKCNGDEKICNACLGKKDRHAR